MRSRALGAGVMAVLALAACGSGAHRPPHLTLRRSDPTLPASTWAGCGTRGLVHAPLPQEPGVYRAGPLTLVLGQDPAQLPAAQLKQMYSGSKAIAVVHGHAPVLLSVDPVSRQRADVQFDPRRGRTAEAALFPGCGTRMRRVMGGVDYNGPGCVRMHATVSGPVGTRSYPLLIPVGNTLRGCPAVSALPPAGVGQITVGVACPVPSSVRCDRVGVGVEAPPSATLVTAFVGGRLVTLNPPDSGSDLWLGYLYGAGLRRRGGPLNTHAVHGRWIGDPAVIVDVWVTVFRRDGTAGSHADTEYLHPGFG